MATCKLCNRSGIFLSVNKSGLCSSCTPAVLMEVQSRLRVINESVKIIGQSKNLETRLSRCDVITDQAKALMKYEERGITVINPAPSKYLNVFSNQKIVILKECLSEEVRKSVEKSKLGTTLTAKLNPLTKVVLLLNDYCQKYPGQKELEILENGMRRTIHEIQLQSFLDDAHLAEFKGNKKKALDKYYEALYFLRHDDIEDTLQIGVISEVEAKIKELSGATAIDA